MCAEIYSYAERRLDNYFRGTREGSDKFNLHSINLTKLEVKSQASEVLRVLDVNGSSVSCKAYEDVIWVVKSRRADKAILHVEGTL
ncbi:hypothetical protein SUGI_0119830 [Cryptomeria japonica]|nr:hypothetical protein SUGI_0119830 [Cryptomeria japonica]